jgi:hypothetical protein
MPRPLPALPTLLQPAATLSFAHLLSDSAAPRPAPQPPANSGQPEAAHLDGPCTPEAPCRDPLDGERAPEAPLDDSLELLEPVARVVSWPCAAETPIAAALLDEAGRTTRVRAASLEELFGALVRKAAWSLGADRRCATLRLELGNGPLQGCALTITADSRQLQVFLDSPPGVGVDVEAWKQRLRRRLASMGLAASFP